MLSTLSIVVPIFVLIFAGWLARRLDVLGPGATRELNRFVVYLALPALLFDIVAHARPEDIWRPGFAAAFGLGVAVIFCLTVALRLRRPRHLADAAIDGLNAAYANVGYIGFPLVLVAIGREALAPTLVASLITVCGVFAVAIVMIEVGLQTERNRGRLIVKVSGSLAKNPLLVAPALAAVFPVFGLILPGPADTFLKLLGGAASPCALVALGLFLAAKREPTQRDDRAVAAIVALKLLGQPAVTWVLATMVFGLPAPLTHTAVLLAALPTGTGPFMLAEFYGREANLTSSVVLVSTVLSVVTISAYLALVA
ncbi:AEC family transporter [Chenggangzhangella methanolivorans]|uniref:AEC family transporter n=1 Tax=Chenggangzhangella methanolivorans TaxID=1437009 RepID=A0A9E6R9N8_9HYPH|nr:AEC family transporter [Chenggangzhangella methanolivorans]QZN99202.1 AEC family transporter [Chenggangzhangella methanolivorans]